MGHKIILSLFICCIVFLFAFPPLFGLYWTNTLFGAWGVIDTASPIMWIFAATAAIANSQISIKNRTLFGLTFFIFALRELDFQKRFTETTFIKINYYDEISGLTHYLAGVLAIVLIMIVAAAAIASVRAYIRPESLPIVKARWLITGWGILVISKILDRAPAKLSNDLDIELEKSVTQIMMTLEEGLEFLAPIIMFGAFQHSASIVAKIGKTFMAKLKSGS